MIPTDFKITNFILHLCILITKTFPQIDHASTNSCALLLRDLQLNKYRISSGIALLFV